MGEVSDTIRPPLAEEEDLGKRGSLCFHRSSSMQGLGPLLTQSTSLLPVRLNIDLYLHSITHLSLRATHPHLHTHTHTHIHSLHTFPPHQLPLVFLVDLRNVRLLQRYVLRRRIWCWRGNSGLTLGFLWVHFLPGSIAMGSQHGSRLCSR